MKISICNKCRGFNYNLIVKKLNKKYKNIDYEIGCNNMCGVGRNKIVLFLNDEAIIAENFDDLLKKIEETIN